MSIRFSKLISFIDFSNNSKSINFDDSFHKNCLLIIEVVTEFIPQSLTHLIIKGITVVFNFISAALPHDETMPASFV